MRNLVLILLIMITMSCGGGDTFNSDYPWSSTPRTEIVVGNVLPYMTGKPTYSIDDQRTVIRTVEDYEFYYRILTGSQINISEQILSLNDVLMVVYTDKQFNVDSVTKTELPSGNTLHLYYFESPNYNGTKYQLYYLEKSPRDPNYVEIVK
jgi:hypothetical protein